MHQKRIRFLFGALALPFTTSLSCKDPEKTKTIYWGNGRYQARPDLIIFFENFTPKEINSWEGESKELNLRKQIFGNKLDAGIDLKNNLYVFDKIQLDSYESSEDDTKQKNILKIKNGENIVSATFTEGFLFGLNSKGEVYQWKIEKTESENDSKYKLINEPRKISSLKNITQISSGVDHIIMLNNEGEVFAMGDDTLGQCGQGENSIVNFTSNEQRRVRAPSKVKNLPKIAKITSGSNHNLAVTTSGKVFGWGSNHQMQLSHLEEFSMPENALLTSFSPIPINHKLENNYVTDIVAGKEFSIFVSKNDATEETEVFSCGQNFFGQLALGKLSHISDIMKIPSLSNYKINTDEGEKNLSIKEIECGDDHCIALTSIGVVMEWGANEFGQLGNKKRSFTENPLIIRNFIKERVISVNAGCNSTSVIIDQSSK